jgi:S1-C subfamily serine protease
VVPDERRIESLGSGLIVDSEGHLLTNHHVVADAGDIRARLLDDRWFETTLVGTDPNTDLALLRLDDANDLPVAPLGSDAELRVGDWVVAIGNPLGLTSTATAGIASGIGRSRLPLGEELTYQDFIQTDASINPGNSGGPLIDADGNVVGINTAMSAEARGIGFAIPVSMARDVLRKLRESGEVRRSWVGLYIESLPQALRTELDVKSGGVLVTGVVEDGPADEAGLRKGDVLLEVGDREVEDVDQVSWLAGHLTIGDPVTLLVQRGNERLETELVPTQPPENTDE